MFWFKAVQYHSLSYKTGSDWENSFVLTLDLVIEGEPCDVNWAGGEEDARGDVGARALASHHNVCRVGPVESLTGTEKFEF